MFNAVRSSKKSGDRSLFLYSLLIITITSLGLAGCSGLVSSASSQAPVTPVAPSLTTQPASQTVTAGQTATFSVTATGTAPLSYQWKKNGTAISGAISSSYTTPATTSSDNGAQFTVVVSNTVGSATSAAASLTVNAAPVAPSITTQPASQTVTAGQTATFSVTATGTAPLSYQWKKNGTAISGAISSSYTTPATTSSDNGAQFTVVVSNTVGSATSSAATLTVNSATTPPSVPTGLSASAVSSSQINLTWNASTGSVAGYKIFRGGSQVGTNTTTSYSDTGLAASTSYTYTVAAYDAAGNTSAQSVGAAATTLSSSGGGGIPTALGWYQIPNTQLQSVCPPAAQWPTIQGIEGCSAVMADWSGGMADTKRDRLIIWGGGHAGYYGNEVYSLNLAANPITLTRLNNPTNLPGGYSSTVDAYFDGNPASRHTYDGLSYAANVDAMIAIGGSLSAGGSFSEDAWSLNMSTLAWTHKLQNIGFYQFNPFSAYDPNSGLVFFNDGAQLWTYNPNTNVATSVDTFSGGISNLGYPNLLVDPADKLLFLIGDGNFFKWNIAGSAPYTRQDISGTVTGCSALFQGGGHGLGAAWDPVQKMFVGWSGGNSVTLFNPLTNSCSTVTYTGGPGNQQANGTSGRFDYFPDLGVFAVCNNIAQNCYTLRLTPASGGTGSPVISNVAAASITTLGATISWTTDVTATTQVEYGTTTAYGTSTTLDSSLVTSHFVQLSTLSANTLYHYRVHSKNSSGVESISGDFAFQTSNTTDTTPPTVSITSPAANATVSGTVTVSANASDNVGVTSVQFLLDGANLGSALILSPYSMSWDTTTTTNGSHTLTAQAWDAARNVGTSTAVSVTVSNTTSTATQNFQARCAQAGVLVCQGFDDPVIFSTAVDTTALTDGFTTATHPNITRDTSVFVSGGSSANFFIPAGAGENDTGNWWSFFGQGVKNQSFGQNSTFYIQYAFRADSTWTSTNWTQYGGSGSNTAPKLSIFHNIIAGSCALEEITIHNHNSKDLPTVYSECGARQAITGSDGSIYNEAGSLLYFQQGWTAPAPFTGYQCEYNGGSFSGPKCFHFAPNQWYTLYLKIHIGTWGSANSSIEAWVAPYGQQLIKWLNTNNYILQTESLCNAAGTGQGNLPCPGFNTVELTQFMTGKIAGTGPAAHVWYDELIISTQPIPAPAGSNP